MTTRKKSTLFLSNLHCPSCAAHIEDALHALEPRPISVSTSIISHTVVVEHPPSLHLSAIRNALEEAGFEIFDTVTDPPSTSNHRSYEIDNDHHQSRPSFSFEQALWKWRPLNVTGGDQKTAKHVETCALCRAERPYAGYDGHDSSSSPFGTESSNRKSSISVTTESVSPSVELFQANIAIDGMTCSSCVGSVTRALENVPWVVATNVSLLTHSASVIFHGKHHATELAGTVEDVGFGAALEVVEEHVPTTEKKTISYGNLWRATYAISGMTCSACTATVSRALVDTPWIKETDVSLISNSATVIFEGKEHTDQIKQLIEDGGYDATLDSIVNLQTTETDIWQRTVSFRIIGMYCDHCSARIINSVKTLKSSEIQIERVPTIDDPILTVRYTPQHPSFTIRHIQQAIYDSDKAFGVQIFHPMSLEERSRRMQALEQRHIFYRLLLSIAAAIPSFIIGIVFMSLVPSTNASKQYLSERLAGVSRMEWATFITATPVYFFAADIFHRRTIKELHALWRPGSRTPVLQRFYRFGSMNMLISFGTTIAYFASIAEIALLATANPTSMQPSHDTGSQTYFDSVVFLTMFLLIGRLLEARSKAKSGDAVSELGKLRPSTALLIRNEMEGKLSEEVDLDLLEIGDSVRVLNGASPPYDGVLIHGTSDFDESALTGESKLVGKIVGDEVFSGTINKGSPVSIRIKGIEGQSMLDQVMKVVREGQGKRAPMERVADILTGYFVPAITLIAITTWIVWMSLGLSGALPKEYLDITSGGWPFWALEFAIAVFVVACPCGIGLAAPTALFVGGGIAAKNGILVKGGGEAFQEASKLDCIVFDKTGTLTVGAEPTVTNHETYHENTPKMDDETMFGILKAVESESSHPIAKALVDFCVTQKAKLVELQTEEIAGKGMKGYSVNGGQGVQEALVGNESLMSDYRIQVSFSATKTIDRWKQEGRSIALLAIKRDSQSSSWVLAASFAISDTLRPEAKTVVEQLQKRNLDVWMISGDNVTTAQAVGAQVGIPEDRIIAGVLPSEKSEHIKKLQLSRYQKGAKTGRAIIAMVGDGINDSPALTTADVGIAIGSGTDVAISSAHFVLVTSNLMAILTLTDLSRIVFRRIKINFGWALVYNLCAIPIAAGAFFPLRTSNGDHIRLDPAWAALAMALSSVSVVCSSLLLRSKLPLVGFREVRERQKVV